MKNILNPFRNLISKPKKSTLEEMLCGWTVSGKMRWFFENYLLVAFYAVGVMCFLFLLMLRFWLCLYFVFVGGSQRRGGVMTGRSTTSWWSTCRKILIRSTCQHEEWVWKWKCWWLLWNSWSIQLHWMTCTSDARYVNGLSWERSAWQWSSKLRMKSIKVMISMYQWRHQYTLMIQELVTVGMLRSPELPPPPAWNDDDKSNTSDATFQSCYVSVVHTNQKELI